MIYAGRLAAARRPQRPRRPVPARARRATPCSPPSTSASRRRARGSRWRCSSPPTASTSPPPRARARRSSGAPSPRASAPRRSASTTPPPASPASPPAPLGGLLWSAVGPWATFAFGAAAALAAAALMLLGHGRVRRALAGHVPEHHCKQDPACPRLRASRYTCLCRRYTSALSVPAGVRTHRSTRDDESGTALTDSGPSRTLKAEILAPHRHQRRPLLPVRQVLRRLPHGRARSALRPHNVMRLVMQDRRDEALPDESIWLCLTCETCSARCPNDCDPARVIDARARAQPRGRRRRRAAPHRRLPPRLPRPDQGQRPPARDGHGHGLQAAHRRPHEGRDQRARP